MGKAVALLLLGFLSLYADGPVLKTGQTTVYQTGDDGTYQTGVARSYTRDNTTGIVTDNATGLEWQDDAIGSTMDWTGAGGYCDALSLGGHSDWRLPSIKELRTLADRSRTSPAIDSTFQYVASGDYWSSTTVASYPSGAWLVGFDLGDGYWDGKSYSGYVRCVRGGQL